MAAAGAAVLFFDTITPGSKSKSTSFHRIFKGRYKCDEITAARVRRQASNTETHNEGRSAEGEITRVRYKTIEIQGLREGERLEKKSDGAKK